MLTLIPQPQRLKDLPGRCALPGSFDNPATVEISAPGEEYIEGARAVGYFLGYDPRSEREWYLQQLPFKDDAARAALFREQMHTYGRANVAVGESPAGAIVSITHAPLGAERYQINITPERLHIAAGSPQALAHATRTLQQICRQSPGRALPCLELDDWPDFARAGCTTTSAAGACPRNWHCMKLVNGLSEYKLNQLQLYVEHTFQFERHPEIGQGASPLSAQAVRQLDAYCGKHSIELVPSLACFGHMSKVLSLPRYRHLAEDWGVGRYLDPAGQRAGVGPRLVAGAGQPEELRVPRRAVRGVPALLQLAAVQRLLRRDLRPGLGPELRAGAAHRQGAALP